MNITIYEHQAVCLWFLSPKKDPKQAYQLHNQLLKLGPETSWPGAQTFHEQGLGYHSMVALSNIYALPIFKL
jgi:hypothetical protein